MIGKINEDRIYSTDSLPHTASLTSLLTGSIDVSLKSSTLLVFAHHYQHQADQVNTRLAFHFAETKAPQGIMGRWVGMLFPHAQSLSVKILGTRKKNNDLQQILRIGTWSSKMSSCRKPDRDFFESFNVSAWQPRINSTARYSHRELGHFSIDEERYFLHNKSKLGTLNLPQDCRSLDIDLNTGFEQWRELPSVQQHLDSILYWILLNKESLMVPGDIRSSNDGNRLDVDFVTSRGNLARILDVLNGKDGKGRKWTLLATRFRGTVYLSHIEDVDRDYQQSTFAQRVCYWGKRFEVEVTKNWTQATSFPSSSSGPQSANEAERHGPLKAYPGFFSVVKFQLENHRIALRAEVDAEMQSLDEAQNPRSIYVELKVTTETIVRAPWAFERKRLIPWWCQSIIPGTPLIVYGIRDYDGHVTSIEHARTDDIPDRVGRENLDPEKYLMLLSDILTWIKGIVCVEDSTSVYAFQWDPNAPDRGVTANALLRDNGNTFLPEWFVREMEDYFTLAGEERQRKGVKRAMEDEKQGMDQEIKLKGIRKSMEESWPRTTSSREPSVRIEKPPARGQDVRYTRSRSPGFHNANDRGRTTSEIRVSVDEEFCSTREPFESGGYKRDYQRSRSPGFHNASDRGRTTSEIRVSVEEERYSTRKSFGSEGYKEKHQRSRLPGFHKASDRGRTASEIRVCADEEFCSPRESFGSEGYKKENPRPSSTREHNEKRPLLYEDQFDRDQTSTRVYEQRPTTYPNRRSRDKIGKTRRYERGRRDDQVQQQARARSRKAFNESRSQRTSGGEYPSSTDDRMRTKRVKPDAEYETRGTRHQDSMRYTFPHRN